MRMTYRVCRLRLDPPTGLKRWINDILGSVLPKADPDFFWLRVPVEYWWLELDEANIAQRELGFEHSDEPVRCAPLGRNFGIFVGEQIDSRHLGEFLGAERFEQQWGVCTQRLLEAGIK